MSPRLARHTPSEAFRDALARLFDTVHTGIYFGTVRRVGEGTTVAANPYLKLMFGCDPDSDDAAIRPFDEDRFVHPLARRAFVEQLLRDGSVTDYLLRLRRADAAPIWVEVTAHTGGAATGGAASIDAVLRDVSERRKLEDEGRDLYHQLLQAEKLAALGQTVSGVAHELNNPLATILTWSERLLGALTRCADETRNRHDPQRIGARREDRAQPADVLPQASHDAGAGGREPGGARDAVAAGVRPARLEHQDD